MSDPTPIMTPRAERNVRIGFRRSICIPIKTELVVAGGIRSFIYARVLENTFKRVQKKNFSQLLLSDGELSREVFIVPKYGYILLNGASFPSHHRSICRKNRMPEKIGVGLASFGMSGRVFHAPLVSHHENFRLARVVERSTDAAHSRYPDVPISRSVDDLLADGNVDLVVVNTPDRTHYEIAKRCLESGKHVIVEKPFTQTVEQGDELIKLAGQYGKH